MGGWMELRQWRQLLAYIIATKHPNGLEIPNVVLDDIGSGPADGYELHFTDSLTRASTIISAKRVSRS